MWDLFDTDPMLQEVPATEDMAASSGKSDKVQKWPEASEFIPDMNFLYP